MVDEMEVGQVYLRFVQFFSCQALPTNEPNLISFVNQRPYVILNINLLTHQSKKENLPLL
jgi:hypothetical protein